MSTRLSLRPPPLWRVHRAGLRLGGVLALCYRPRHHRSHGHVTRDTGRGWDTCCCDEAARAGDHIGHVCRCRGPGADCGDRMWRLRAARGELGCRLVAGCVLYTALYTVVLYTVHCTRPPVPAHLVPPSCRQWCRPRISPGPGLGCTGGPHTGHTHHCADLNTSSFSDLTIRPFESVPLLAHFVLVCSW